MIKLIIMIINHNCSELGNILGLLLLDFHMSTNQENLNSYARLILHDIVS